MGQGISESLKPFHAGCDPGKELSPRSDFHTDSVHLKHF